MKTYKTALAIALLSFGLGACDKELKENTQLSVDVTESQNVTFDGKTVTVKRGTPVTFNLNGDPDFITFFSGEIFKEYKHKDRTMMQPEDLDVCQLTFGVWSQWGAIANADITLYISDKFPGIAKNNFEADRKLLDEDFTEWEVLLDKTKEGYPTIRYGSGDDNLDDSKVNWVSYDLKSYLGKKLTFAISYRGVTPNQPKFYFRKMKMEKLFNNGLGENFAAKDFTFTPVNMLCKENLPDQANATYIPAGNKEYGYVTNNVAGIWKLNNWTEFSIHSSAAADPLKYSWLVSDPISIDASCSPDTGTSIKNITQSLPAYTYTYDEAGTYTATFVANSANYVHQGGEVVHELIINVVD